MAALKAIMLDFDGVLVESTAMKTAAFAELFAGEPALPAILDLHRRFGGVSRHEKFRMIHRDVLRRPLSDERARALGLRFAALVDAGMPACPPVAGAERFLAVWSGSVPLFVVSGTPEDELRRIVADRGLDRRFRGVFGSPRDKPTILRAVLAEHGWSPDETLFVGDAETDARAALEVGVPFIGRTPPGEPSPFSRPVPTVADLAELRAMLEPRRPVPTPERAS